MSSEDGPMPGEPPRQGQFGHPGQMAHPGGLGAAAHPDDQPRAGQGGWGPPPAAPGYAPVPPQIDAGFVPTGPATTGFVPPGVAAGPAMFVPSGHPGVMAGAAHGGPGHGGYGAAPGFPVDPRSMAPRSGVLQLRPQSVGDVLDVAFKVIRGNPGGSLGTPLFGGLLAGLVTSVCVVLGLRDTPTGGEPDGGGVALVLLGGLLSALVLVPVSAGLVHVFGQAVLGRRASAAAALRVGLRRTPAMLGLMALTSGAVIAGFALLIGIMVLASRGEPGPAWILLFAPFMVGLLFLAIRLCLAGHVVVLESAGPIRGLRRSWALTRRRFWRTLGVVLLAQLALAVISYVLQTVLSLLMLTVVGFSIASAENGDTAGHDGAWGIVALAVIMVVLTMLTAAITYPFLANVIGGIYADARIRDEGLAARLAALPLPDPTAGYLPNAYLSNADLAFPGPARSAATYATTAVPPVQRF